MIDFTSADTARHAETHPSEPGMQLSGSSQTPRDLHLWMRLTHCCTLIENELRSRLRAEFQTTLPRFEFMCQLVSAPRGLKMSELSRRMMVTNGNITGIADQLEKDGLIERTKDPADRRSSIIRLTPTGRRHHRRMQRAHDAWVRSLMSGLPAGTRQALFELLGDLRQSTLDVLPVH